MNGGVSEYSAADIVDQVLCQCEAIHVGVSVIHNSFIPTTTTTTSVDHSPSTVSVTVSQCFHSSMLHANKMVIKPDANSVENMTILIYSILSSLPSPVPYPPVLSIYSPILSMFRPCLSGPAGGCLERAL